MELLGLVFIIAVWEATKAAGKNVAGEYRKDRAAHVKRAGKLSRPQRGRHAAAWWTREVTQKFPVTRDGFRKGWLAHQRQAEAQARGGQATAPPEQEKTIPVPADRLPPRSRAAGPAVPQPTGGTPVATYNAGWNSLDDEPLSPNATVTGPSGTRRVTGTLGNPVPVPNGTASPTTTGGNRMSADTNYTTVRTSAQQEAAEADALAADLARLRQAAENRADEMQAAGVDPATVAEQMEHAAQLRVAEQALTGITETGENVSTGQQQRHGGIKEAHDDAPVKAAASTYYED